MHPLKNCLQGQDFLNSIPVLFDNLNLHLGIPKEQLNRTLESLNKLDNFVIIKGIRKCLEPEIFPALIAYIGEVIKDKINVRWESILHLDNGEQIYEPWLVAPNGNTVTLHDLIYKYLYEGKSCYLKVTAETAIRRLTDAYSVDLNLSSFSEKIINVDDDNETDRTYDVQYILAEEAYIRVKVWLKESIKFYQKFSFFQEYIDFSEDILSSNIEIIMKNFKNTFDTEDDFREFMWEFYPENLHESYCQEELKMDDYLLRMDTSRCWSEKEVSGIKSIKNRYISFFKRLSQISRGVFYPKNVKAVLNKDTCLIMVSFTLNGIKYVFEAEYYEDSIDIDMFKDINSLMTLGNSNYKFEICDSLNNTLVLVLTEEEKQSISKERGLIFNI